MMDRVVDAMVTPEMVRAMLQGQRPQPPSRGKVSREVGSAPQAETDTHMGYEAHDRFVVTMRNRTQPEDEFSMVWRRSGLTWKLSALRMPAPK